MTSLDLYRTTGDVPCYARQGLYGNPVNRTSITSPIGEWAMWHNSPNVPVWLQRSAQGFWDLWLAKNES